MVRIKNKIVSRWYATPGIYDVIVYKDGVNYYAKDGRTGRVIYSSDDSETLLQYVLNKANDGDIIYIKDVVYADTLISRKKVTLTGPGAIYTKTGKLVRLLGNIEVKDLEVDFYTPRSIKNVFVEQFLDHNLGEWGKIIPSDGSVQVYEETRTVDGIRTVVERGVVLTGGSSSQTFLYRQFRTYKKMRVVAQVVDVEPPTDSSKVIFAVGIPASISGRPFSGAFMLNVDTSGVLVIRYVKPDGTFGIVNTGVNISSKPVVFVVDVDGKNGYATVNVDNKKFDVTDWKVFPNLKYVILIGDINYRVKFNSVYVESIDDTVKNVVTTVGRPDTYHPVGVSDSLGVYALGLVYPDNSTHVEVRDLKTDALVRVIDLDETLNYSDEHEYVYTRFSVEDGRRYLYVLLCRHGYNYTMYKIDVSNWSVVWKMRGGVSTYGKLIWGWVTGLAVLYRDRNLSMAIDHIDKDTGNIVSTDVIVSSDGNVVYGYFSPNWSPDGYLWLAWSTFIGSRGLRSNVYVMAIDRSGNAYAPDGSRVSYPVSSLDSNFLIETSDHSQPIVRPVREGAVVVRTGFFMPNRPSAWWLRRPGRIVSLELPQDLPLLGLSHTVTIGRIPAVYEVNYVLRWINNMAMSGRPLATLLPSYLPQSAHHLGNMVFMPAKDSRLLVVDGSNLYIYTTGFPAHYDGEIII
jgi:hypothetical protein